MNPIRILPLALITATLAACGGGSNTPPASQVALLAPPDGALVATVNGEIVTEPLLLVYARGRGLDPADPTQRQQALDGLIENLLLAQDGIARGLTDKPEVQAELTLVRMQQLSGRSLADYRAGLSVSDEQVAQYYQQEVARAGDTEWLIEHILLGDRAAAEAVLARVQQGVAFDALIAEQQHTAKQARQLGWSNATQLPSELVEALRQLEDGEVAPVPIETSFGWHVLRRADSRPFNPPSLEQVRDGARRQLLERAVAEHVQGLRAKSSIATGVGTP